MRNQLLLCIALLSGCADIQTRYPLTDEDVIVVPNPSAIGGPYEAPIKELSNLLVDEINPALEIQQQMLEALLDASKKKGEESVDEITLFFDRGISSLEYSYSEPDRLVGFIDYMTRKSQGRKILFVFIGRASDEGDEDTNIQLAVERSKAPVKLIEKYLVNVPFEIVNTYAVGNDGENAADHEEKYQHVRIIATFDKSRLPTLPKE